MARRSPIREKFESLLAKPLSDKDRSFVESLFSHYNHNGSLTLGRRRCLSDVQERYSDESIAARAKNPLTARFDAVMGLPLSDRDKVFIDSLRSGFIRYGSLTPNQETALSNVEQRYSDEGLRLRDKWENTYLNELRERMLIVANYYASTEYFKDVAVNVLTDSDYIPSRSLYKKMCENKYALKVLEAAYGEPKYKKGQLVEARKMSKNRNFGKGKQGFIMKVNADVITSAVSNGGGRKYSVLPLDSMKPVIVEERDMKKGKKNKK